MKTNLKSLLSSLVAAAAMIGVLAATPASAQQSVPTPQIGVIDIVAIVNDSLAGKGVALEYEKRLNALQNESQDLSAKFQAEADELRQQQNMMAPDVFRPRAEEFQKRFQESNQSVNVKKQRIDLARDLALRQLNAAIVQIAQRVAQNNGLNMILFRQQLLSFDPGFDITRQVLTILDREVEGVEFPDPATIGQQANSEQSEGGE